MPIQDILESLVLIGIVLFIVICFIHTYYEDREL